MSSTCLPLLKFFTSRTFAALAYRSALPDFFVIDAAVFSPTMPPMTVGISKSLVGLENTSEPFRITVICSATSNTSSNLWET